MFQPIKSTKVLSKVPINFRGPNNEWTAVAKRSRVFFYNPKKVSADEIKNISYESLANDNWRDRIVIRSSNNMYNQSLVASLIAKNGEKETEAWAKALVRNLSLIHI